MRRGFFLLRGGFFRAEGVFCLGEEELLGDTSPYEPPL